MINVKTNKGVTSLHVNGSLSEIVADVFIIVKKVYDAIEDEEAKAMFKKLVTERINEPFMTIEEMEDFLDENHMRDSCKARQRIRKG